MPGVDPRPCRKEKLDIHVSRRNWTSTFQCPGRAKYLDVQYFSSAHERGSLLKSASGNLIYRDHSGIC